MASSDSKDKDGCRPGSFYIKNNLPTHKRQSLLCGLYQPLKYGNDDITNARGLPPIINASPVGSGQHALFTPITTVYIWVEANHTTGSVISHVSSQTTEIKFLGTKTHMELTFNRADSTFIPSRDKFDIDNENSLEGQILYHKNPAVFCLSVENELVDRT